MQVNCFSNFFFIVNYMEEYHSKSMKEREKEMIQPKLEKKKGFYNPQISRFLGLDFYRNTTQSSLIDLLHLIPDACFGFLPWVQGQTNGAFDRLLHLHVPK